MTAIARTTETLYKARMKIKHLRTEADIVTAFGGKKKMAEWFMVSHQAVCNWFGEDGTGIPTGYQYRLYLWATSVGHVLHPVAFGLKADGTPIVRRESKAA